MRQTSLRLLPLCLAIAGVVHAQEPGKPSWILCRSTSTLPLFTQPLENVGDRSKMPTDISANDLDVKKDDVTVFQGDVKLLHGDQWLNTDQITYTHQDERFVTHGPVRYQDQSVRLTADQAAGDQKADTMQLDQVQYQFNQELGNGQADKAVVKGEVGTLTNATYSTCPPGQRQWEFSASQITVNQETATGVATNVSLRLGPIPVIWLPVISFPTDDRRRTGVLMPTIGRDDVNGLDFKLPVYLNLAPNYDATLTPRWLSKRGVMLEGEFRYLDEHSHGIFEGTYLPSDDITGHDRSSLSLVHVTSFNQHWSASANLNRVSDKNYLSDFGNSIYNTSISLLSSEAGFYGRGRYWSASISTQIWQIANPLLLEGNEPYRRLPRLQASFLKPLNHWLDAGIDSEAVNFSHETLDGGQRVDLEPFVRMSFGNGSWFVNPKLAWRYTAYSLDDGLVKPGQSSTPTRSLPITSLDAGAYFERNLNWGEQSFIQTLEPRLYYLRVPFRNQDDLPVFDTRELTFGWTSLFRDNRFGGADRQSDANQVTMALTSRLLRAKDGQERLSVSVGRITYFDPPRVTLLPGTPLPSGNGSDWVAQMDLALTDWWSVGATQQWDPDNSKTQLSSLHSQIRLRNGAVINAAYRYRRSSLEQTDLSMVIPVSANWNLYGRWNYSLRDNQTLEALGGFEWKSCCVAVRLLGRQFIRSFASRQNLGLYLEIELNGLGSFGRSTSRLLDNAIPGYDR